MNSSDSAGLIEQSGNPFAAELLERSASGFAGYAANAMLDRCPDLRERYQPDPFANWKGHITQRILELAAAVNTGEPLVFSSRVMWSRKAFLARGQDESDLHTSLVALREVLSDNLPPPAADDVLSYLDQAIQVLSTANAELEESELDPSRSNDRIALRYLQSVLEGKVAPAIDTLLAAIKDGMSAQEIYLDVLLPAQREIGRLWHLGDVTVAEEHLVTFATQRAMAVVVQSVPHIAHNGKTMVAAAVAGNVHDIGLRAVSDVFQMAGWKTIFLGCDLPMQDLPGTVAFFEADLLVLTATLSTQLPRTRQTIRTVRERCTKDVKILVGGGALDEAPNIWRKLGADAYSSTIDESLRIGNQLVGL